MRCYYLNAVAACHYFTILDLDTVLRDNGHRLGKGKQLRSNAIL